MIEIIIVSGMVIVCTIVMGAGAIMVSHIYSNIAIVKAEIAEAGKNTRERINVRADMMFGDDESDDPEAVGGMFSEFDGLARMLGYSDAASAMSDPAMVGKIKGMVGGSRDTTEVE